MTDNSAQPDFNKNDSEDNSQTAPAVPGKVRQILQELEMMSLQKGMGSSIDIASFDKEQKDKLLDLMGKNEDNTIKFHTDRISAFKEIELAKISSSNTNNTTFRYVLILGLVLSVVMTLSILFFKDDFFIPWLTFLTGFVGGVGVPKVLSSLKDSEKSENPIKYEEEN